MGWLAGGVVVCRVVRTSESSVSLSVLLPVSAPWPLVRESLDSVAEQAASVGGEVLVLDGHGEALPAEPEPPVRWLRAPGADTFELRVLGMTEARGEILATTEDHCVADPGWCAGLLAAAEEHPDMVMFTGATVNGATRRSPERASYAVTFGPFAPPVTDLPPHRAPPVANIAIRRSAFNGGDTLRAGWLEYELPATLRQAGLIGIAPDARLNHVQRLGPLQAVALHFHNGRSRGADAQSLPRAERRSFLARLPSIARLVFRQAKPALGSEAVGPGPLALDRTWVALLALSHTTGQLVGAFLGPGGSRRHLS